LAIRCVQPRFENLHRDEELWGRRSKLEFLKAQFELAWREEQHVVVTNQCYQYQLLLPGSMFTKLDNMIVLAKEKYCKTN